MRTIAKLRLLLDQLIGRNPQDPTRAILKDEGVLERLTRHYPFPANFDMLIHHKTDQADQAQDLKTFSAKDWGIEKHCYVLGAIISILGDSEYNIQYYQGLAIELSRSSDSRILLSEMLSRSPINKVGAKWYLRKTFPLFIPCRISSTDKLASVIENWSGQIVTTNCWILYFTEDT